MEYGHNFTSPSYRDNSAYNEVVGLMEGFRYICRNSELEGYQNNRGKSVPEKEFAIDGNS